MRISSLLVLCFTGLLLWSACQSRQEMPSLPTPAPLVLPKLVGYPQDGAVQLTWGWLWWGSNQPAEDNRPDAFRLLMGSTPDELREVALISGDETNYRVRNLRNREVYYFSLEILLANQPSVPANLIAVAPDRLPQAELALPAEAAPAYWGSWSGDGQQIAYVGDHPDEPDGAAVFTYHLTNQTWRYRSSGTQPHWRPQQQELAFVTDLVLNRAAPDTSATYLALLAQDQVNLYLGGDGSYLQPTWSPDGRRLAFLGRVGADAHFDLFQTVMGNTPAPQRLTDGFGELSDLSSARDRSPHHLTWHPNGQQLAYDRYAPHGAPPTYTQDIFALDLSAPSQETPLITSAWADQQPAFSPDGTQLAYLSDRSGVATLWLRDLALGTDRQLYDGHTPAVDVRHSRLSWSPQGDRLLFNAWLDDSTSSLFWLPVR